MSQKVRRSEGLKSSMVKRRDKRYPVGATKKRKHKRLTQFRSGKNPENRDGK